MKKGLFVVVPLLLLLALSTVGLAKNTITIGFSQMENNMPFRIAETNDIKNLEKKYPGVKVITTDAQSSLAKQIADCEDLIARGVDFLVIAPREYEGFQPVFDAAKRAKIPVMLIDRDAQGVPGKDFVTMAGANFWYEGRTAALLTAVALKGKGNIVELTGTPGSSVARDREGGFHEVINYFPDLKIIASQTGNFTRMEALEVMENIIQQHGKKINAVYAHNDEMALGAIQALEAAGFNHEDVFVVSIDGQKSALKAILDGKLDACIECPPYFGEIVYQTAMKVLNGEEVPTMITLTNARIFTKDNVKYHYDPNSDF